MPVAPKVASAWPSDCAQHAPFADNVFESCLKVQHLKSRPQFQAVLAGATVARSAHFALHRLALPASADGTCSPLFAADDAWLGAMVPKRWARRAVTRNTIKRQVYALGLSFEAALCHGAHVVRLHRAFDRQQFPSATSPALKVAVRAELSQLFGTLGAPC